MHTNRCCFFRFELSMECQPSISCNIYRHTETDLFPANQDFLPTVANLLTVNTVIIEFSLQKNQTMSAIIVKFRAGLAEFNEDSKLCTPNPLKGEVVVKPSEEAEGFYDFQWKPIEHAANNKTEPIELILIPGETKWTHIQSSKNGRVFSLLFSSGEKYFFWLQDKVDDGSPLNQLSENDKQVAKKIDDVLKVEEEEEEEEEGKEEEEQDVNMDAEEPQEEKPKPDNQPISHLSDFLTRDLMADHIQSLDENSTVLQRLYSFLPESYPHDKQALIECIRGPFFSQASDNLSKILRGGPSAGLTLANAFGYKYVDAGTYGLIMGARGKGLQEKREEDTEGNNGNEQE